MPEIVMYTTTYCPYCTSAKSLLDSKGASWEEINLDREPHRRAEMIEKAQGRRTVPQIFVDGKGVGGFDELAALDRGGDLDGILQNG